MEFSHLLPGARAEAAPFFNHVVPGERNPTPAVALRDIFSVRALLFRTSVFCFVFPDRAVFKFKNGSLTCSMFLFFCPLGMLQASCQMTFSSVLLNITTLYHLEKEIRI